MKNGNITLSYFAFKGQSFAPTRAKYCPSQGKNVLTKGKIWEKNVRDVNLYFLLRDYLMKIPSPFIFFI